MVRSSYATFSMHSMTVCTRFITGRGSMWHQRSRYGVDGSVVDALYRPACKPSWRTNVLTPSVLGIVLRHQRQRLLASSSYSRVGYGVSLKAKYIEHKSDRRAQCLSFEIPRAGLRNQFGQAIPNTSSRQWNPAQSCCYAHSGPLTEPSLGRLRQEH